MRELRETIFSLSNERAFNLSEEMEVDLYDWVLLRIALPIMICAMVGQSISFIQTIVEDRVRLSAAGLFQVGMHLLPSVGYFF